MGMEMTKHAFVQLIAEKASKSLHDAPVFLKKVKELLWHLLHITRNLPEI